MLEDMRQTVMPERPEAVSLLDMAMSSLCDTDDVGELTAVRGPSVLSFYPLTSLQAWCAFSQVGPSPAPVRICLGRVWTVKLVAHANKTYTKPTTPPHLVCKNPHLACKRIALRG